MAMAYLPVHAQMAKLLKKGLTVVHNGGSGYQGAKGVIQSVNLNKGNDNIAIRFSEIQHRTGTIYYSTKWFLENFYVFVGDIQQMSGFFHGTSYFDKYSDFTLYQSNLLAGKQPNHSMIKKQVDQSSLFEVVTPVSGTPNDVLEGVNKVHSIEGTTQDPLDAVGYFKLVKVDGVPISNHKSQRLAEIAGAAFTRDYNEKVAVWRLCSEITPKLTVEAIIHHK